MTGHRTHRVHEDGTEALNEAPISSADESGAKISVPGRDLSKAAPAAVRNPRHKAEEGDTENTGRWAQVYCSTNRT